MFLFLLACGGDIKEDRALMKDESLSYRHIEKAEVREMQREMEQTKKDLGCIAAFLEDRKNAQAAEQKWEQPTLKIYEEVGCKSMYTVKVEFQSD